MRLLVMILSPALGTVYFNYKVLAAVVKWAMGQGVRI